jgi:3-carboxy-cis,cis-muconate cycloisomerase
MTLPGVILRGTACEAHLSTAAYVSAIVRFELALARAQASIGLIPSATMQAIESAVADYRPDLESIVAQGHRAGTPVVEILRQLRSCVERRAAGAGEYVHTGATSQDALDTATALCLQPCVKLARSALERARTAAFRVARTHAEAPVLARTLLQAAGITTFGFKSAQWGLSLRGCESRLTGAAESGFPLQLAGAIGTGLGLGDRWTEIQTLMARELGLSAARWQVPRDATSNLLLQLALTTGVAVKIAGDLALMNQTEIAEIDEPSATGGVSSAMPHKRNPVMCMRIRGCGHVVQGLSAAVLATMDSEHERGLGSWQAELAIGPWLVSYAVAAIETLADLLEGVKFDAGRALRNIERAAACVAEQGQPAITFDRQAAVSAAARATMNILSEEGSTDEPARRS